MLLFCIRSLYSVSLGQMLLHRRGRGGEHWPACGLARFQRGRDGVVEGEDQTVRTRRPPRATVPAVSEF